jgi:hypothetical protein
MCLGERTDFVFHALTIRLSDARLRRRPTKLVYLKHPLPPWLTEDVPAIARTVEMDSSWNGSTASMCQAEHVWCFSESLTRRSPI